MSNRRGVIVDLWFSKNTSVLVSILVGIRCITMTMTMIVAMSMTVTMIVMIIIIVIHINLGSFSHNKKARSEVVLHSNRLVAGFCT